MLGVKTTLMRPVWLLTRSGGREKKNNKHISLVSMNLSWKVSKKKKMKKAKKGKEKSKKGKERAHSPTGLRKREVFSACCSVSSGVSETGVGSSANRTLGCTPKPHLKSSHWSGITNHNAALYSRADKEQHGGHDRLKSQP